MHGVTMKFKVNLLYSVGMHDIWNCLAVCDGSLLCLYSIKSPKLCVEYMEKCIIAICKLGCVGDQCGRKLQLPYNVCWKL